MQAFCRRVAGRSLVGLPGTARVVIHGKPFQESIKTSLVCFSARFDGFFVDPPVAAGRRVVVDRRSSGLCERKGCVRYTEQ